MTPTLTKAVLTEAREIIAAPGGWNQDGGYFGPRIGPGPCACIYGAIAHTLDPSRPISMAQDLFYQGALEGFCPDNFDEVIDFNDDDNTTLDDVLAFFDRAIAGTPE